jgi:AraC-like DNA-binding protein
VQSGHASRASPPALPHHRATALSAIPEKYPFLGIAENGGNLGKFSIMQTLLERDTPRPLAIPPKRPEIAPAFDPGLDEAREVFSKLGMELLQTRPARHPWTCAITDVEDWKLIELQSGAPSILLAPAGYHSPVFAFQNTNSARFCGCPWPENQIAAAETAVPFVLLLPAKASLHFFFSTKSREPLGKSHAMMFLPAPLEFRSRLQACSSPGGVPMFDRPATFPSGDLQRALRTTAPLDRRAHRDADRVARAFTKFLLQPEDPPTASYAEAQGISSRTMQYAFTQLTDIPLVALRRILRLHAARALLVTRTTKKVSQAAACVGIQHLGRFSVDYRILFGESPTHTLNRPKILHPLSRPLPPFIPPCCHGPCP